MFLLQLKSQLLNLLKVSYLHKNKWGVELVIIFINPLTFIDKIYFHHILWQVFGFLVFVTEMCLSLSVWNASVEPTETGTLIGKPSSICPPNSLNLCVECSDHMCPDTWADIAALQRNRVCLFLVLTDFAIILTASSYCNTEYRNW